MSVYGLLTKEIKNYASNSDSQWVRLLDEHVKAFDKLLSQIPSEYLWRYQSSELLQQELKKSLKKAEKNENFLGCNQLIWGDTWETIHGAKTLQIRRLEHLTCGAITMLSQKNFLAFAILSRSVLEVAMWNVYHSVVLEKSVAELVNMPSKALINNGHVEELLTKLIWGSNQQHTLEELKQLKVLKVFKKVAEARNETPIDLEKIYDYLSEFVHPNVEGHNLFVKGDLNNLVSQWKAMVPVGVPVCATQHDNGSMVVRDVGLEGISWSLSALLFSVSQYNSAGDHIATVFSSQPKNVH